MRVVFDPSVPQYVVSHTVSYDNGGNIQMGMSAIGPDGVVRWTRGFPAAAQQGYDGHASHPYALALAGAGGGYVIGGLAVIMEAGANPPVEQCEGRMIRVNAGGGLVWDSRFLSTRQDTNVECYGVQATHDGGFIMTCGTGVEPELHPGDSPRLKTWMALVIRVDGRGDKLYEQTYTDDVDLKSNAGEYIIATRDGGYALYIDSKGTYGPGSTGGNFALMRLGPDDA